MRTLILEIFFRTLNFFGFFDPRSHLPHRSMDEKYSVDTTTQQVPNHQTIIFESAFSELFLNEVYANPYHGSIFVLSYQPQNLTGNRNFVQDYFSSTYIFCGIRTGLKYYKTGIGTPNHNNLESLLCLIYMPQIKLKMQRHPNTCSYVGSYNAWK